MSSQLSPYLIFDRNCSEAMKFYQSCLGGELTMQKVSETPMAAQMAADMQDRIIHSTLKSGEILLMAADNCMSNKPIEKSNQIALCINCGSEEDINSFFSKLSEGGTVSMPLKTEFWGDTFGQLTDKFGIDWMMNYSKNKQAE